MKKASEGSFPFGNLISITESSLEIFNTHYSITVLNNKDLTFYRMIERCFVGVKHILIIKIRFTIVNYISMYVFFFLFY